MHVLTISFTKLIIQVLYFVSVMRLPMKMTNVSVEDLGRESATFMLEACDAFFVDLNSGDG